MLFFIGVITMWLSHLALKKSARNPFFAITWTIGMLIVFLSLVDIFTL